MMNLPTLPSIDVLKTITPKEKINRKKKRKETAPISNPSSLVC